MDFQDLTVIDFSDLAQGCWIVRRSNKQIQIKKGLPQSIFSKAEKYPLTTFHNPKTRQSA